MKSKYILGIVIVIILISALVYSFSKRRADQPAATKPVIKIGVAAPLSGVRADAGEFTKNALVLAEEKINSNKLSEYHLQFVYEDTKYEPKTAVSVVNKLIEVDRVNYIIGPYGSSEVLAAVPVAEKAQRIVLLPGAQSDEVSQLGDHVFRLVHHTSQEAPVFGAFLAEHMKSESLPFLAINTGVTPSYLENVPPVLEQRGKKLGMVEKFEATDTDFRTQLLKIKQTNPTDLMVIATPKQTGLILKQADELGLKVQFYSIGVEGPELVATAGSLADGLFYPYSYDSTASSDQVRQFHENYLKRFGMENDTIAANVYDAAMLLSQCLEKTGDNVEQVKDCLYQTKDYPGASGTFSIDQNGDAVKHLIIKTIRDGKLVKYQD